MTQTIEELAREYVNDVYSGDTDFIDEAENVLTWLFEKSLASRLTPAEKERVRKMYNGELEFAQFYQRKANSCVNQQCRADYEVSRDIAKSRAAMLERIFGEEIFKEE